MHQLRAHGINPESVNGILVTHEHGDHVAGLHTSAKHLSVPVYMTRDTHNAWQEFFHDSNGKRVAADKIEFFTPCQEFRVGDIEVFPFTVPHDAADPVGFAFTSKGVKIGYATDLGYLPTSVREHLRGCDGLMIEADYESRMLESSALPAEVKERRGQQHLSNEAVSEFLASDYDGRAVFIVLAHLSEQNRPKLARVAAENALKKRHDR